MRIFAVIRKEMFHILRDIRVLYFSLVWPVLLLIIFGFTVSFDVKNLRLTMYDLDQTRESRELLNSFAQTGFFRMQTAHDFAWKTSSTILDRGKAQALIIVPRGFARQIARGEQTHFQVLVDGSDNNTAKILLGYLTGTTQDYNQNMLDMHLNRLGMAHSLGMPIDNRMQFLYNPALRSQNFIVPGLIAVIMMIIGTLLTTLTITVEWERGTMEQLLNTPIKPLELIIGKITPYFAISMIQVTTVLLTSVLLFKVPFRGSILLFYTASALFLLGALGIGIFLSLISRTQQLATMIAFLVTFLPAFLLSGFIFPIANMPVLLRLLSYLVPAKYFLTIVRAVFLKNTGISVLWPELCAMLMFSLTCLALARMSFRKKIG